MSKTVLRQSRKYLPFFLLLSLVGFFLATAFAMDSTQPTSGRIVPPLIGLCFGLVGLYGTSRTLMERVIVSESGVEKFSAPFGKRTFDCTWSEVMAYDWKRGSETIFNSGASSVTYVLTATRAQLRVSSEEAYFPRLHSLILSNIGDNVKRKIRRSETPKSAPFEQIEVFQATSSTRNSLAIVGLSMLLLGLVAGIVFILIVFRDEESKAGLYFFAVPMVLIGVSIVAIQLHGALAGHRTDVFRVNSSGIQRNRGSEPALQIPWSELKSVEYLYGVVHERDTSPGTDGFSLNFGSRRQEVHYYAVIGSNGKVMEFNTKMRDFGRFISSLVEHAPLHTAICLHRDLVSIRRM